MSEDCPALGRPRRLGAARACDDITGGLSTSFASNCMKSRNLLTMSHLRPAQLTQNTYVVYSLGKHMSVRLPRACTGCFA